MEKKRFWDVDLVKLLQQWTSELKALLMTIVIFAGLSLPVVISGLILWYLVSIGWKPTP